MNERLAFDRECYAFDEKIALAELEVSKAEERVKELRYQKARFLLDFLNANMKAQQAAVDKQAAESKQNAG